MYDAIAKGFDRATGEVLAWLNADDLYEPGVLLRVGRYFAEHPDQAVLYFTDTVWKQGWRVSNRFQRYVGLPELLLGHILYQDSVFFRRARVRGRGGTGARRAAPGRRLSLVAQAGGAISVHVAPGTRELFPHPTHPAFR